MSIANIAQNMIHLTRLSGIIGVSYRKGMIFGAENAIIGLEKVILKRRWKAMDIKDSRIDNGKAFDWGRVSQEHAAYRDIYPKEFYSKIAAAGLCVENRGIPDIGTGTGVLPRNKYAYGAKWVGADISENQIEWARRLSEGKDIDYIVSPAEDISFAVNSFDVITACRCFWYFNHEKVMPKIYNMLRPSGRFLVLSMEWLPYEDQIALASEELVLKYNPSWSGAGETVKPIEIPKCYEEKFELIRHEEYRLNVHFTRESWNGRMKACRGIGASLGEDEIKSWEEEHMKMLCEIATSEFDVLHFAAAAELKKKQRCGE